MLECSLAAVPVRVRCRDQRQRHALDTLWRRLFVLAEPTSGPGVTFDLSQPGDAPVGEQEIHRSESLAIRRSHAGYVLESSGGWIEVDATAGRARGALSPSFWQQDTYAHREFFLLALMMVLRPHGRYGLHANALVKDGLGVLLVGHSGSGKTTLTLGLLRSGWSLLSDDAITLRADATGVEALAFRQGLSTTSETERSFPEVARAPVSYLARGKCVRDLRDLFPQQLQQRCSPALVVFPRIVDRADTRLVAVDTADAVLGLAQQSAGIMTDPEQSQLQLQLLGRLAEQASSVALLLGRDALAHPARVSKLLLDRLATQRG